MQIIYRIVLVMIFVLLGTTSTFAIAGGYLEYHPQNRGPYAELYDSSLENFIVPENKEIIVAKDLEGLGIEEFYIYLGEGSATVLINFHDKNGKLLGSNRGQHYKGWMRPNKGTSGRADYITVSKSNPADTRPLYVNEIDINVKGFEPPEPEPEPPEPEPEITYQETGICETCKKFWNTIFGPPIAFLDMAIDKLNGVTGIVAQGLNIGKYFAIFGDLPTSWQLVVTSILISTFFLGSLLIFRSILRMYYAVKEGVKWW